MSLWKNKMDIESAPKWYARRCMFDGADVTEEGKLDLSKANTQFETGDCVIYFAETPITGLENKTVYYLRALNNGLYDVCKSREEALDAESEAVVIAPIEKGVQMFIKDDDKETTKDGSEEWAVIPVDGATASLRLCGMNSIGWYRYRKYMSGDIQRVRVEHLVSLRNFVDGDKAKETLDVNEGDINKPNTEVTLESAEPITGVKTVKAKAIKADSVKFDSSRFIGECREDINLNLVETSGDLPKSTANASFSLNNNGKVVITNSTIGQTGYNAIEIGLKGDCTPSEVLIEGVEFDSKMSNNAILIFAHKENANITIRNCTFTDCSNAIRFSNRTNVPANILIEDCTIKSWESNPEYAGMLCLQDYTSQTPEEADEAKRFGKLNITVRNVIAPNGYAIYTEDASTVCGTGDEHQICYVYEDATKAVVPYDETKYPKFTFEADEALRAPVEEPLP